MSYELQLAQRETCTPPPCGQHLHPIRMDPQNIQKNHHPVRLRLRKCVQLHQRHQLSLATTSPYCANEAKQKGSHYVRQHHQMESIDWQAAPSLAVDPSTSGLDANEFPCRLLALY